MFRVFRFKCRCFELGGFMVSFLSGTIFWGFGIWDLGFHGFGG